MLNKTATSALTFTVLSFFSTEPVFAQDEVKPTPSTKISGYVDAYYRYNFQNAKAVAAPEGYNNKTSFTNSHNSFELGMASVKLEHSLGKVSGTLDVGYGRRAEEFSYNDAGAMAALKQAFISYAPADVVTFTLGKFGTHVGYELLDPQYNRNYSMSYMFSYGPFFHTGLKMDVAPSDNVSFMIGVANPTDYTTASFEKKFLLGQFHAASSNGVLSGYLNYAGGKDTAGTASHQLDLVLTGKVSDKFNIGYNGTTRSLKPGGGEKGSFWGSALYLNYDPTEITSLTLRGEYFDDTNGAGATGGAVGTSVFSATLSANFKVGGLTIIPELRHDAAKDAVYYKKDGATTKGATSFLLAAVYSF
ncbi:MAG: outer membrane beta-barrel protein [Niabella sp.]